MPTSFRLSCPPPVDLSQPGKRLPARDVASEGLPQLERLLLSLLGHEAGAVVAVFADKTAAPFIPWPDLATGRGFQVGSARGLVGTSGRPESGPEFANIDGVDVTVTAGTFLKDLCLVIDRLDPAAVVDSMLITLLPGESHTFSIRTRRTFKAEDITQGVVLRCANDLLP